MTHAIIQKQRNAALSEFKNIVATPRLDQKTFYAHMCFFLNAYPLFLPPYIEILEMLECDRNYEDYNNFLAEISHTVDHYVLLSKNAEKIVGDWNYFEIAALKCLLERSRHLYNNKFSKKFYYFEFLRRYVDTLFLKSVPKPSSKQNFNYLQKNIDVEPMVHEVKRNYALWYISSTRQKGIPFHRHTQSITLRAINHQNEPSKNAHTEGVVTKEGEKFVEILTFVDKFASTHNVKLGRVALVRLKSNHTVYRHYDVEEWLKDCNRYHLVLTGNKGKNILSIGADYLIPEPGDLFFYNNKTLHKSYNLGDTWRTHLIFDTHKQ